MLLAIDDALGLTGRAALDPLRRAFGPKVVPFLAPLDEPDAGLLAALRAAPLTTVLAASPTPWLARLGAPSIKPTKDTDLIAAVAAGLGLTAASPPTVRPARVAPMDAGQLRAGLDAVGAAWQVEIGPGAAASGLVVELVALFEAPSYEAAASFVQEIAVLAEAQDHHPTLVHAYRTVTVRVTTGEAGRRLSARDLGFAEAVDRLAQRLNSAAG